MTLIRFNLLKTGVVFTPNNVYTTGIKEMNFEICKKCIAENHEIHPENGDGIIAATIYNWFFIIKTNKNVTTYKHHDVCDLCRVDCNFSNPIAHYHEDEDISKVKLADHRCKYYMEHKMLEWVDKNEREKVQEMPD